MKKFKTKVIVKMKPEIKDTRGQTLMQAINSVENLQNLTCHVGNVYYLTFDCENQIEALKTVERIAEDILSNHVIELYEIRYLEEIDE